MEKPHLFIHPDVVEEHLKQGTPIPLGTVKLLWVMKALGDWLEQD